MLALSHRGTSSQSGLVSISKADSRGRVAAVLRRSALVAVLGLFAGQLGCDNPTHIADKRVQGDVDAAVESQKYTLADGPPVASALNAVSEKVPGAGKAVESLPALGAVKGISEPESMTAWRSEELKLTARQRGAIAAAIRTAARTDHAAVRYALSEIVEKNKDSVSPETLIAPLLRQADIETAAGDSLAREAQERDITIGHLSADVQELVAQIRLLSGQVESLISTSPVPSITHVDEMKAKVEGADDKADWIGSGDAAIPTVAKHKALKADLEKKIAELKQQKGEQEAKVKELQLQAAKSREEASSRNGDVALNLSKDAANKEFAASLLLISGDPEKSIPGVNQLDSQIADREGELSVLESRAPVLGVAQKLLETRRQNLGDSWLSTREQLTGIAESIAKIIGAGGGPSTGPTAAEPVTLVSPANLKASATQPVNPAQAYALLSKEAVILPKLAQIKALSEDAKKIREEAGDLYQSAISHVNSAAELAKKATDAVNARKDLVSAAAIEQTPLKGRLDFFTPKQFDFAKAAIEVKLGRLGSDKVVVTSTRNDLRVFAQACLDKQITPIFQAADDALGKVSEVTKESPAWEKGKLQETAKVKELAPAIAELSNDQDIKAELTKADEHYAAADKLLNGVLDKSVEGDAAAGSSDTSDSGSVSADDLLTVVGQTKRAALGLSANMLYSRAHMFKAAGDGKGYDTSLKVATSRTKEYRKNYGDRLPPPAMPPGAPPEMYAILGLATTRPTIRPDTQPTGAGTPATGPATPATGPADGTGSSVFGGPPATAPTSPGTPTDPSAPPAPAPTTPPTTPAAPSGTPTDPAAPPTTPPAATPPTGTPTDPAAPPPTTPTPTTPTPSGT